MRTPSTLVLLGLLLAQTAPAQHETANSPSSPMYVAPASDEGQRQIKSFTLAPGLVCDLVAAEPQLANPVVFAIDDQGRFWVCETFRIGDGGFDTRSFPQWKDEDLACRTVADRLVRYGKHIANDFPRLANNSERVHLLTPGPGGVVTRDQVYATNFNDLADGVAAGVLPVGNDVFFACIPKLWRLTDQDGDGVADQRKAVFDGFGVHTSLIGHDLHGLIVGPDRRLYFSIGDRGFRIETEGRVLDYPHEGAVLRCELDGSKLEVIHRGLRNPQELAFNDVGDLFTCDNNSDAGDRARFTLIVHGGDTGWCIGHQWLDDRGRWMRERMWEPQHAGQPAWIVPPLFNLTDGPSGLTFDPGLGLPDRFRGCFFLCDFRGGASYSGVHALRLRASGGGYELERHERPIWGVLATDCEFGPDGALYVSDWVDGWGKTGKGRIYRVRTQEMANDMALRSVASLLAQDFTPFANTQLAALLNHVDRRIRQKAEFALVDQHAVAALLSVAKNPDLKLARLHAIWGLGILGRKDAGALDGVMALLNDGDAEVRAQAAKVLGDVPAAKADAALVKSLQDLNSRVRLQGAIALGRRQSTSEANVVPALLQMLRDNDDRDPFLRHAASYALAQLATPDALLAALKAGSRSLRLGTVLALRLTNHPGMAAVLNDSDVLVATEAARAIYDLPLPDAMPKLAAMIRGPLPDCDPLVSRVLNANRWLGTPERGDDLLQFAHDKSRKLNQREEAMRILAEWHQPHGQDRVSGNWRPVTHEDANAVMQKVADALPALLTLEEPIVAVAAEIAGRLKAMAAADALLAIVRDGKRDGRTRSAALRALDQLDAPQLAAATASLDADTPAAVRQDAVQIFARRNPEQAVPVLATLLQKSSPAEQQGACLALAALKVPAAAKVLAEQLDRLARGEIAPEVQLELLEAAQQQGDAALQQKLAARTAAFEPKDVLAPFRECQQGGDPWRGRELFFKNEATRCTRCHTCQGIGGTAGPVLDGVGKRRDVDYLLRALVAPSADICEGFTSTVLELHSGVVLTGIAREVTGAVEITDIDGKVTQVTLDRIKKRSSSQTSAMPVMTGTLSRRELRDVQAFLQSLQTEAEKK